MEAAAEPCWEGMEEVSGGKGRWAVSVVRAATVEDSVAGEWEAKVATVAGPVEVVVTAQAGKVRRRA